MNYRHLYHAGNFADLIKHLALIFCLESLSKKESPFFVLDTHAGAGKYNLEDPQSLKTGEADFGVKNLLRKIDDSYFRDENFSNYLKILCKINLTNPAALIKERDLTFYPGSPYIIKYFLRDSDKAIFAEKQNDEFIKLKKNFSGNKKITTLNENGFELLKSKLPPLEKRGLILIDPAFEKDRNYEDDYSQIIAYLKEAKKRFQTGIYIIWHPIIDKVAGKIAGQNNLADFYEKISALKFDNILKLSFKLDIKSPNLDDKMNKCGLVIINAPWQLENKVNSALTKLSIKSL
jgi:23S rRNA (adenine2030-N6)-methyltransferase